MLLSPSIADRGADPDKRLVGVPGEPHDLMFYRRMRFIRRFEQTLLDLFEAGAINGTTHCCIGQEANSVGIMDHLNDGDHVFSNHRCHGHYLARTGDALGLLAEIMGKVDGICGGIGGSQHIGTPSFKSNGIQGGIVPAAAGIAMAEKLKRTAYISVVFIGDGTLGEGVVYETMNIVSLWKLPLLVVLENNGWSQSTPLRLNCAGDIAARFTAFGLPVRDIETTDVRVIDRVAGEEITRLRETGEPRVLLIHTYRLCHHSHHDDSRPRGEVETRWNVEPLLIQGQRLADADRQRIETDVDAAMKELVMTVRSLP